MVSAYLREWPQRTLVWHYLSLVGLRYADVATVIRLSDRVPVGTILSKLLVMAEDLRLLGQCWRLGMASE